MLKYEEQMNRENRLLVTDEPVEVQDFKKITNPSRRIYRIYIKLIKKIRKMSTCNQLDLETLGSQPVMPKNLPGHCKELREVECTIAVESFHDTCST